MYLYIRKFDNIVYYAVYFIYIRLHTIYAICLQAWKHRYAI